MKILSHRGYWKNIQEKNTTLAFQRSFELDFGTETDVRDLAGNLVISHDMPTGDEVSFTEFLSLIDDPSLPLAINIKSDGLALPLAHQFASKNLDWFVFDMSVPDMRAHLNVGNPVFARMSEVEQNPAWLDEVQGVWLDAFSGQWFDIHLINTLLNRGKRVCIVSPELHGRDPKPLWDVLVEFSASNNLMLCTDYPEEANVKFFGAILK